MPKAEDCEPAPPRLLTRNAGDRDITLPPVAVCLLRLKGAGGWLMGGGQFGLGAGLGGAGGTSGPTKEEDSSDFSPSGSNSTLSSDSNFISDMSFAFRCGCFPLGGGVGGLSFWRAATTAAIVDARGRGGTLGATLGFTGLSLSGELKESQLFCDVVEVEDSPRVNVWEPTLLDVAQGSLVDEDGPCSTELVFSANSSIVVRST